MAPPPVSKKRKLAGPAAEKIEFDFSAREEYLTGFHKRKVARMKHAQEENAKKEKEEKLRFRRELRAERKVDLEKHVEEVNRLVAQANGDLDASLGMADSSSDDEEEFTGFAEPEPVNQEDEYIDEDKYTTVTVESVNISKAGLSRPGEDTAEEAAAQKHKEEKEAEAAQSKKRVWTKEWPKNNDRPKKKKIKFRYETKLERKANRVKEGIKKRKQKEARTKDT